MMDSALERELKLDVELGFRLPDLEGEPIAPRTLLSVYYDTPDYRLARYGVTVRRRTEKRRSRWQVKLPHGAARLELELPSPTTEPAADVRRLLVVFTRGASLVPIATLRTRRSGVVVRRRKRPVAEVVLDAVSVLKGRRVVQRFREVEVELVGSGTEKDLRRIAVRLRAAGAHDGDGRPKVFRALGLDTAARPR